MCAGRHHLALGLTIALVGLAALAAPAGGAGPARGQRPPAHGATAVVDLVRTYGPWYACGILHDIGAIEVRVVRAESGVLPDRDLLPGRHLIVWLSCPADSFPTRAAGARLRMTLTARRPPWPHNLAIERRLPRDQPQLYARAVTLLWAPPPPAHRHRRSR